MEREHATTATKQAKPVVQNAKVEQPLSPERVVAFGLGNQEMLRLSEGGETEPPPAWEVTERPDEALSPAQGCTSVQAKLMLSRSGDMWEREADAMAEQVVQRKAEPCACGGVCPQCQAEAAAGVQRKVAQASSQSGAALPNHFLQRLGAGRPLDRDTRAYFEAQFGQDFSRVRIHEDEGADASARSIQARAFTAGQNVVFRSGQFAPETEDGKRLLAHELTHVVQQGYAEPMVSRKTEAHASDTPLLTAAPVMIQRDDLDAGVAGPADAGAGEHQGTFTGVGQSASARINAGYDGGTQEPADAGSDDEGYDATAPRPGAPPAAGTIYVFEGVQLSEDETFVRHSLEELILSEKNRHAASRFADRLAQYSQRDLDAGRQLARDQAEYGSLPGGVAPTNRELQQAEDLLSARPRLMPVVRSVVAQLKQEDDDFLAQFEAQARINLGGMLTASEERVTSERDRYGLRRTYREVTRFSRADLGPGVKETKYEEQNSMGSNAGTQGLATAARELAGKVRELRALIVEHNDLQSPSYSEYDPEPIISDPVRYELLGKEIAAKKREYALLRNQKEQDYPILAAYTPIASDAYMHLDRTIDALTLIGSGSSTKLAKTFNDEIEDRLKDIGRVWDALKDGSLKVWDVPSVIELTKMQMGVQEASREGVVVAGREAQARQEADDSGLATIVMGLIAGVLGIIAAIPSGGSSLVAAGTFIAGLGAAGISSYLAYEHLREYMLDAAKNGTDFDKARAISQEEPSLFWLALDIAGAILDIHAAAAAFRTLSVTAKATLAARRANQVAEAKRLTGELAAEGERLKAGLGTRLTEGITEQAGRELSQGEQALKSWERTLNQETRSFLVDHPHVRAVYAEMDDEVRAILSHCSSNCILPNVSRQDITRVRELLDRLKESGAAIDENIIGHLKVYFHVHGADVPGAMKMMAGVRTVEEMERKVVQAFRNRARDASRAPLGPAVNRNVAGTVSGGSRLPGVGAGENWLRGVHRGQVGLIPEQIASQLRGRAFNSFDEFRQEFWRLIAADPELSKGFNADNLKRMAEEGQAPFGLSGQGGYELHHITPLEHGGALYDLDNIAVVTDFYHNKIIHNTERYTH